MPRKLTADNWKALEAVAKKVQKEKDTRDLAEGTLSLIGDLMYLNGCVKRGRGSDLYPDRPFKNVFEYIKELEGKNK